MSDGAIFDHSARLSRQRCHGGPQSVRVARHGDAGRGSSVFSRGSIHDQPRLCGAGEMVP